jgi:hypothetical protein
VKMQFEGVGPEFVCREQSADWHLLSLRPIVFVFFFPIRSSMSCSGGK